MESSPTMPATLWLTLIFLLRFQCNFSKHESRHHLFNTETITHKYQMLYVTLSKIALIATIYIYFLKQDIHMQSLQWVIENNLYMNSVACKQLKNLIFFFLVPNCKMLTTSTQIRIKINIKYLYKSQFMTTGKENKLQTKYIKTNNTGLW